MKQLTIVVKPFRAEAVLRVIAEMGVTACAVREAKGYGRQKGYLDRYRGSEYSTAYLPKVEITVWVTDEQAAELARCLEDHNQKRQILERRLLADARQQIEEHGRGDDPALVLAGAGWHPGLIGIVASRLVDLYGRPALMISVPSDGARAVAIGSGRSIPGLALHKALHACGDLLEGHGGQTRQQRPAQSAQAQGAPAAQAVRQPTAGDLGDGVTDVPAAHHKSQELSIQVEFFLNGARRNAQGRTLHVGDDSDPA